MRKLLQVLAAAQHVNVKFVPIPWQVIWFGLKIAELFRITMPFRSDSVISFVHQNPAPAFSLLTQAGCTFREFSSSVNALSPLD